MSIYYHKYCNCKSFKDSEPQLMNFTIMAHHHGVTYTGDVWDYCAWCGNQLKTSYTDTLQLEFTLTNDNHSGRRTTV